MKKATETVKSFAWALFWGTLLSLMLFFTSTLAQSGANTIKVVVVDTGLYLKDARFSRHLCPTGHRDFTGFGIEDRSGHGTHVTSLIQRYAQGANYCIVVVKYFEPGMSDRASTSVMQEAITYAMSLSAPVVNVSSVGPSVIKDERYAIASHPGTLVIAAAGNVGTSQAVYPCAYSLTLKNVRCIGSVDSDGSRTPSSNYGPQVNAWEQGEQVEGYSISPGLTVQMSGTSMSTAIYTGKYVKRLAHESR